MKGVPAAFQRAVRRLLIRRTRRISGCGLAAAFLATLSVVAGDSVGASEASRPEVIGSRLVIEPGPRGSGLPGDGRADARRLIQPFAAEYKVTRSLGAGGFDLARASLRLELGADGSYRYSSSLRPARIIAFFYGRELSEHARGQLIDGAARPIRYEMALEGRRPRSGRVLFDRDGGTVTQRFKGEEVRQRVPPEALDRLSIQLEMALDLAAGRETMQYLLVDRNRLRVYRFEVTGRETVETPIGRQEALRVELAGRLRLDDAAGLDVGAAETEADLTGENRTIFWFAPGLDYLPAQIRHEDEDLGVFTMVLEAVEMPGIGEKRQAAEEAAGRTGGNVRGRQ